RLRASRPPLACARRGGYRAKHLSLERRQRLLPWIDLERAAAAFPRLPGVAVEAEAGTFELAVVDRRADLAHLGDFGVGEAVGLPRLLERAGGVQYLEALVVEALHLGIEELAATGGVRDVVLGERLDAIGRESLDVGRHLLPAAVDRSAHDLG